MKRLWIGIGIGIGIAAAVGAAGWWHWTSAARLIPHALAANIPAETRQLVLVVPEDGDAVTARVWLLARDAVGARWRIDRGPLAATVGRNGTGWGRDGSGTRNPGGYPDKREGDGRSPAGVFLIPSAFGTGSQPPAGVRLPWLECTPALRGVDDARSKYYNQIVDEAIVPDKDWDSAEIMLREDGLYESGLVIAHNADRIPGGGSCIFIHLWRGPGEGTAGCTALDRDDVRTILTWLNPVEQPRLALGVAP